MKLAPCALLLSASVSFAQVGGQKEYETYCSACHAPDGQGAGNGTFPPLAESPWVAGDPTRAIKVVLHGLEGPVEVHGKTFNLEMPPQGAMLKDDQIAAILTYVRSSWGNKGEAVTPEQIAAVRSAHSMRKNHWTAEELEKTHPLEAAEPPIKHLISRVYHGEWERLPDFSALKAVSIEEEHAGRISAHQSDRKDHYGIVWDGVLEIKEDGGYTFEVNADDGIALYLNEQLVAKVDGIGPMSPDRAKQQTVPLKTGEHKIRIEYFEGTGGESVHLAMRKEGEKNWKLLSKPTSADGKQVPPIPISPPPGEAILYRNFLENVSPRGIGVGYDGGVNLAFSADTLSIPLIWTGEFIDGGLHWTDRGQGKQKPSGSAVVRLGNVPGFAKLAGPDAPWPAKGDSSLPSRFRGYKLDAKQRPTFIYEVGGVTVHDQSLPSFPDRGNPALERTLEFRNAASSVVKLHLLLAEGDELGEQADGHFTLEEGATLQVGPDTKPRPLLRTSAGKKQLILPLDIAPGQSRITLRYQW